MDAADSEPVDKAFQVDPHYFTPLFGRGETLDYSLNYLQRLPQVHQVVREIAPRERFALNELLRWVDNAQRRYGQARRRHAQRRAFPDILPRTTLELSG